MTSARMVTPGQTMATTPTTTARTPSKINEVDSDLNKAFPFLVPPPSCGSRRYGWAQLRKNVPATRASAASSAPRHSILAAVPTPRTRLDPGDRRPPGPAAGQWARDEPGPEPDQHHPGLRRAGG